VNTEADARLHRPGMPKDRGHGSSGAMLVSVADGFGFGLTALLGGWSRRSNPRSAHLMPVVWLRRFRLIAALLCTAGLIGLAGCACFSSSYMSYTVAITGTNSVPGSDPQSITVTLLVAQ